MFSQMPSIPARYLSEINKASNKSGAPKANTATTNSKPSPSEPTAVPVKKVPDPDNQLYHADPADIVASFVTQFAASKKIIRRLRALPMEEQPTASDAKTKLCLSWHLKGFCYPKCMNVHTHRPLDAAETATFQAFLTAKL